MLAPEVVRLHIEVVGRPNHMNRQELSSKVWPIQQTVGVAFAPSDHSSKNLRNTDHPAPRSSVHRSHNKPGGVFLHQFASLFRAEPSHGGSPTQNVSRDLVSLS